LEGSTAQTHDAKSAADAAKRWFAEHGVPQFAGHYSFADRMNALVLPLALVIAVQVGVGTWLSVSIVQLLVVPPGMVMVGLLFKRALDGPLGLGPFQGRGSSVVAFWLLRRWWMPYLSPRPWPAGSPRKRRRSSGPNPGWWSRSASTAPWSPTTNVDGLAEAVLPSAVLLVLLAVSASARLRLARRPGHQPLVTGTRRLKDKVSSPLEGPGPGVPPLLSGRGAVGRRRGRRVIRPHGPRLVDSAPATEGSHPVPHHPS
jgi:hypothetical protein